MRRRLAIAATALGLLVAAPAAATADGPVAHAACQKARIQGNSKCIARGQFCAHNSRAERDYRRYGFTCSKRDARGNWHLQ
jgi:hypothetical protein